jgi:hypothetical protein
MLLLFTVLGAPLSGLRKRLLTEILGIEGLLPLLMKPRNGQPWTRQDVTQLYTHFKRLSAVSSYFIVLVLPGSVLVLPLVAWWLDRRRRRRLAESGGVGSPHGSSRASDGRCPRASEISGV